MNIYLHVELADRELDSKLLLAVVAAKRGHSVLISDIHTFDALFSDDTLPPGIFHTKDLCAEPSKIERNKKLLKNGFKVTSLDDEAGIIDYDYQWFCDRRYSEKTIPLASAIFCWGLDDAKTLSENYPNSIEKIHTVGSPRADLWSSRFKDYWPKPWERPYLLVSCNFGKSNNAKDFSKMAMSSYDVNLLPHENRNLLNAFSQAAEGYEMMGNFLSAISHLSRSEKNYDIIVRPHLSEKLETWDTLLKGMGNVYVLRFGSITPWVSNAFAVMHNSCTTAIEAAYGGTPVITFIPFEQRFGRSVPNDLGISVHKASQVAAVADEIFLRYVNSGQDKIEAVPKIVDRKIYNRNHELSSERIVDVFESFSIRNTPLKEKLGLVRSRLRRRDFAILMSRIYRFSRSLNKEQLVNRSGYKFQHQDKTVIHRKVKALEDIIGGGEKINFIQFNGKTFYIGPRSK